MRSDMVASGLLHTTHAIQSMQQWGNTALHRAAAKGNAEILQMLLNAGAKPSAANEVRKSYIDSNPASAVWPPQLL